MPVDRALPAAHNPRSRFSLSVALVGSAGVVAIFLPFTWGISPLKVVAQARTMALRIAALAILAVTLLGAGDATGQTPPAEGRLFAGGALAGNWVHTDWGTWIDPQPSTWNSNGRLAVGFSFGARISERWSVQVEAELPTGDATRRSEYRSLPGGLVLAGDAVPGQRPWPSCSASVPGLVAAWMSAFSLARVTAGSRAQPDGASPMRAVRRPPANATTPSRESRSRSVSRWRFA